LRSGEEFKNAHNYYSKHVVVEAHEHVTFSWDPLLPLPFKHPCKFFNLVPYMLRKYGWLSNSIDNFKKQLAIYWAFLEGGWAKWVDNVFSMLVSQSTMKDQVSITNCI
jgi:hypothetical protein